MLFGVEGFLPEADRFGRDLYQFIFIDEFQRLFERQIAKRDQTDRLIGR